MAAVEFDKLQYTGKHIPKQITVLWYGDSQLTQPALKTLDSAGSLKGSNVNWIEPSSSSAIYLTGNIETREQLPRPLV